MTLNTRVMAAENHTQINYFLKHIKIENLFCNISQYVIYSVFAVFFSLGEHKCL